MIDWTDVLDIGLPEIDRQHRKLISLSNSLIQAMTIGKGKDVLSEFFEELKAYTVYHSTMKKNTCRTSATRNSSSTGKPTGNSSGR